MNNLQKERIKIDESKIARGQVKYVLKLMKLAKDKGFEEGQQDILKYNIRLMEKQLKINKGLKNPKIYGRTY